MQNDQIFPFETQINLNMRFCLSGVCFRNVCPSALSKVIDTDS